MKLRPFELALVIIFVILGVIALFLLSTFDGSSKKDAENPLALVGEVKIWGTMPAEGVDNFLRTQLELDDSFSQVSYSYFSPTEFDDALLRAIADGVGPDLLLVSQEKLVEMRRRIQPISYESFPVRDIKDKYVDGAQIFALSDGLYGFPIAVDPLMMYWNRDILATEGFLEAPRTWESLVNNMFPKLIKRNFDRTIKRSVVAMGEYGNVRNAFGVISALFIQGGSQRVIEDKNGTYLIKLQQAENDDSDPLRAAADFYTRFSKPSNTLYSWNRAFDQDRQQFIAGDLALYFGYASEGVQIERSNPNLNFDIAEIPQGSSATKRRTYGRFYALSLLRSSDNQAGAILLMQNLGGIDLSEKIAIASNMVPAQRSWVTLGSNDNFGRMSYQSASIAVGWLNPNLVVADNIFRTMTQDINENRSDVSAATADASSRLKNEY